MHCVKYKLPVVAKPFLNTLLIVSILSGDDVALWEFASKLKVVVEFFYFVFNVERHARVLVYSIHLEICYLPMIFLNEYDPLWESVANLSTIASSSAKILDVSLWNTCSDAKKVCKFETKNNILESYKAGSSSCSSVFRIS